MGKNCEVKEMKEFNILTLHIKEKDTDMKGSWIKVSGASLTKKLKNIIGEIATKKGYTKTEIYYKFSKIFNCHKSTAKRHFLKLNKEKEWISLFFIKELLRYWKVSLRKSKRDFIKKKFELQKTYKYLKVGQQMSPPIKCVKNLNIIFCKIAGAHAADGHLNRKNGLILEDGDRKAVEIFNSWIKEIFGIEGKIFQHKNEKGWRFELYNKTISRYLQIFFGFPIGKKSQIVDIPKIIKNSNLTLQKAFLCGAFTFDGSITMSGDITYTTYSKNLASSIYKILNKIHKSSLTKTSRGWNIKFKVTKKDFWLFEPTTKKYEKLKFFLLKNAKKNLFQTEEIENIIKKLKIFDLKTLSKNTKLKENSLVPYIKILLKEGKIRKINNNKKILSMLVQNGRNIPILIEKKKINELFIKLMKETNSKNWKQLSNKLDIHDTTLSVWKNRQSGISSLLLKKWSQDFGINLSDLLKNCEVVIGKRKFYECANQSSSFITRV